LEGATPTSIWWLGTLLAQSGDTDAALGHLQRAVAIYVHALGTAHPTIQQCQQALVALDRLRQTCEQQIAQIRRQAEAAVASALAENDTKVRTALAEQLKARAQQAEAGEEEGLPYLALAAHLRGLAARLHERTHSSAPGDTDAQDDSAS
jgi:hypothetical protein